MQCRLRAALLAAAMIGSDAQSASAHDLRALFLTARQLSTGIRAQQAAALRSRTLQAMSRSANIPTWDAEQVIDSIDAWELPHIFSICFDQSSSTELRRRIVAIIEKQWPLGTLAPGRLGYGPTFNSTPTCSVDRAYYSGVDIRVTFDPALGYWAQVGPPSPDAYATLNLAGFNSAPPANARFAFLVAHEFGHVLGLIHELQHPEAPQCRWDKTAIMRGEGWSDVDWETNMASVRQFFKKGVAGYSFLPYDRQSVMHYHFPPEYFMDGARDNCYIPADNVGPDAADYRVVAERFSSIGAAHQRMLGLEIRHLISHLGHLSLLRTALEAKARELVKHQP